MHAAIIFFDPCTGFVSVKSALSSAVLSTESTSATTTTMSAPLQYSSSFYDLGGRSSNHKPLRVNISDFKTYSSISDANLLDSTRDQKWMLLETVGRKVSIALSLASRSGIGPLTTLSGDTKPSTCIRYGRWTFSLTLLPMGGGSSS